MSERRFVVVRSLELRRGSYLVLSIEGDLVDTLHLDDAYLGPLEALKKAT